MGMGKGCGEVYSALEMKDGYCIDCQNAKDDISEQKLIKDKKKLEKVNLFTIKDIYFVQNTRLLTLEEKKRIIIDIYSKDGFIVNNISYNQIQFRKEKTFSLLWSIIWLLVAIIGIIVYIFYYMSKKDTIITITIDPEKCKDENKRDIKVEEKIIENNNKTKELFKLKDMLEKNLISKDEFNKFKAELLCEK